MRIAIEGQRLFRKHKHGMDFVALELIKAIQTMDTDNEYFVFVKPDEDRCLDSTQNVKIVEIDTFGGYPLWEQRALPKAVKQYGCELLHCTSNTAPIYSDIPLIITLHDIIYMESLSLFGKGYTLYQRLGNMYRRLVVPKVLHKAQKVITVSKFEQQRIQNFFNLPDNTLTAIYNGVGTHFKVIEDASYLEKIRQRYQLPQQYFFFLGNTDPKKNTEGVLRAYDAFVKKNGNEIKLLMLDFDEIYLLKLLEKINAPELRKNIHLAGYVPNTDLPAIYNLAKVFLYPSLRESFGIPILEAMACGTPVIASNTSSMPEVAGDAAILINPKQYSDIQNALEQLITSTPTYQTYREKGLQRASEFSWHNMATQVIELYQSILKNS